jgi:hypothetical protein
MQKLDEVQVVVETCEQLRSTSANQGLSSLGAPGTKYSFINKVIDGMTVYVNAVLVTFKSPAFIASVQVPYLYFNKVFLHGRKNFDILSY